MDKFEWSTDIPVTANNLNEMQDILINDIKNSFTIETSGDWTIKKYDNGYCEMYHNYLGTFNISGDYSPSSAKWVQTPSFSYPITLTRLISANASVGGQGHLLGCNFSGSNISLTNYSLYIYDLAQSLTNYKVRIYTRICGMWK